MALKAESESPAVARDEDDEWKSLVNQTGEF